jgi:hypothetical protein
MLQVNNLLSVEQIKQVKARYWRAIDSGDSELLRTTFTEDCLIDFRGSMGEDEGDSTNIWTDRESFLTSSAAAFGAIRTIHHGFVPEIDFTAEGEATAIWPMEDIVIVSHPSEGLPFTHFHGWGHYHDRYRETADGWRMCATRLVRTRIEMS